MPDVRDPFGEARLEIQALPEYAPPPERLSWPVILVSTALALLLLKAVWPLEAYIRSRLQLED